LSWWYLFTCSISVSCIPLFQYLTLSASRITELVAFQDLLEEQSLAEKRGKHRIGSWSYL